MGEVEESSSSNSLAGGSDACEAGGGASVIAPPIGGSDRKLSGLRSSGTAAECSNGAGASSVCTLAACVCGCSGLALAPAFFLEYAIRRRVDFRVT